MGDKSKIEWTATIGADGRVTPGATWNPLRAKNPATGKVGHHCVKISPACTHCYAARQNKWTGTGLDYAAKSHAETFLDEQALTLPLRWRRPRKIFVCSMTDLFGDWVSDEQIDRMFAVMALADRHTFQVLTKRPERMEEWFRHSRDMLGNKADERVDMEAENLGGDRDRRIEWPLSNVWVGVTAEDQERADLRVPLLCQTPAAVRFISAEPLLGAINLVRWLTPFHGLHATHAGVDWLIVGGESGPGARPMHPDWARGLRDQCVAAGVPFFFKQWGEWAPEPMRPTGTHRDALWIDRDGAAFSMGDCDCQQPATMRRVGKKAAGRLLDGREWNEFPAVHQEAAR